MSDRLTAVFPGPRTVRFGGRDWPVPPATLADVAALQSWVDAASAARWADAWATADDHGLTGGVRDRALFDALDAEDDGPPAYDDPGGASLLLSTEGVLFFVGLALRRGTPGLSDDDVAGAVVRMDWPGFAALRRAFYAVDDAAEACRRLTDHVPRGPSGGRVLGWGEVVDTLCERYGIAPREAREMTLPEVRNALRRGKPALSSGTPIVPGQEDEAERLRVERLARAYPESPRGDFSTRGGSD